MINIIVYSMYSGVQLMSKKGKLVWAGLGVPDVTVLYTCTVHCTRRVGFCSCSVALHNSDRKE